MIWTKPVLSINTQSHFVFAVALLFQHETYLSKLSRENHRRVIATRFWPHSVPMDADRVALSRDPLRRWPLLKTVLDGRICLSESAEWMRRSYRQAERFRGRAARDGSRGLLYRNRGRKPGNALAGGLREQMIELSRTESLGFPIPTCAGSSPPLKARESVGRPCGWRRRVRSWPRGASVF